MSAVQLPRTANTTNSVQRQAGSFVVSGSVVNCSCGSLRNTVRLISVDRGSFMGESGIIIDADTKPENFTSTFGICSKSGGGCMLAWLSPRWTTAASLPEYERFGSQAGLAIEDIDRVVDNYVRAGFRPIVIESILACWHMGHAGLITIHKNGQEFNFNPFIILSKKAVTAGTPKGRHLIWNGQYA